MSNRVIPNPIINSPFAEPRRHFQIDEEGITDQIVAGRQRSSYFVPIAQPKKKAKDKQLTLSDWTADRIEENKSVNSIRERVKIWREGGYQETTGITRRLLERWKQTDRYGRLFFCQIDALEATARASLFATPTSPAPTNSTTNSTELSAPKSTKPPGAASTAPSATRSPNPTPAKSP